MREESETINRVIDLDPLVTYLMADRLGNPYDYQDWTPKLREAVRRYLVNEISDEFYAKLLDELACDAPSGHREVEADLVLAANGPWDVSIAAHRAVVSSVSSLDELIYALQCGQVGYAFDGVDFEDIAIWLRTHLTHRQRSALLQYDSPDELVPPDASEWWFLDFGEWLMVHLPAASDLLRVWRAVTGLGDVPIRPPELMAKPSPDTIRAWAKEHGYQVGERGRLPREVMTAYQNNQF